MRMTKYVASKIDEEVSNLPSSVSKCLVLIVEFVQTIPGIQQEEQSFVSLAWLKRLIPALTDSELQMCSHFLQRILEASQGLFALNSSSSSSSTPTPTTLPAPAPAPAPAVPKPAPKPIKKSKSIWKKNCLDAETSSLTSPASSTAVGSGTTTQTTSPSSQ